MCDICRGAANCPVDCRGEYKDLFTCPDCNGSKLVCYDEHGDRTNAEEYASIDTCETCEGLGEVPEYDFNVFKKKEESYHRDNLLLSQEEKRYAVTIDLYVYASSEEAARAKAENIARELDQKHDNKASVLEINRI